MSTSNRHLWHTEVHQIGAYSKVDRDPRGRTVTVAYLATTRRSVRSYDATKKISESEVRELLLILLNQYLCNCKTAKQL